MANPESRVIYDKAFFRQIKNSALLNFSGVFCGNTYIQRLLLGIVVALHAADPEPTKADIFWDRWNGRRKYNGKIGARTRTLSKRIGRCDKCKNYNTQYIDHKHDV